MVDLDKALHIQLATVEEKPGGMCQYTVRVGSTDHVDAELEGWLRAAFDAAS